MFKKLSIKTKNEKYNIIIGYKYFSKFIKSIENKKIKKFIIIDYKVYKNVKEIIPNKKFTIIKLKGNEKIKSIKYYWKIISILLKNNIDRNSVIICVGGGTLGDLVGFIASTILRGVDLILVPSTLLSQVDSSIGGKNGINARFGKNLIGTFYHPKEIIIDPYFLKTLSLREIKSGYAEIIKHAIIYDKNFYNWLKENFRKIYNLNINATIKAIEKSIKIKSKFIKNDENENLKNNSSRAILNFGHTFGHAIESLNNYKSDLTHGEAISIGMIVAAKISYDKKNISKNALNDIIQHFRNASLPVYHKLIKTEKFCKKLLYDKKNIGKKLNLILLKKVGKAYFAHNQNIDDIKKILININK